MPPLLPNESIVPTVPDPFAQTIERIARHAREKANHNWSTIIRTSTVADLDAEREHIERLRIEVQDSTDDLDAVRWVVEEIGERLDQITAELNRRKRHREPQHLAPNRYSAELARELKADTDLAMFMAANGYSNLRAAGDHYVGRCIFHSDKTPSMHVWADHLYCFGCGMYADVFDLLRETAGLPWRAALDEVASFLHRSIPEPKP